MLSCAKVILVVEVLVNKLGSETIWLRHWPQTSHAYRCVCVCAVSDSRGKSFVSVPLTTVLLLFDVLVILQSNGRQCFHHLFVGEAGCCASAIAKWSGNPP